MPMRRGGQFIAVFLLVGCGAGPRGSVESQDTVRSGNGEAPFPSTPLTPLALEIVSRALALEGHEEPWAPIAMLLRFDATAAQRTIRIGVVLCATGIRVLELRSRAQDVLLPADSDATHPGLVQVAADVLLAVQRRTIADRIWVQEDASRLGDQRAGVRLGALVDVQLEPLDLPSGWAVERVAIDDVAIVVRGAEGRIQLVSVRIRFQGEEVTLVGSPIHMIL